MDDMKKDISPEELKAIISSCGVNNTTTNSQEENNQIPKQLHFLMENMKSLSGYVNHLEQGLMGISLELYSSKHYSKMLAELLIEKGIVTGETFKELIEEKVNKPVRDYIEEMNKKQQEAVDKTNKAQQEVLKEPEQETVVGKEIAKEEKNNVILASERFTKKS